MVHQFEKTAEDPSKKASFGEQDVEILLTISAPCLYMSKSLYNGCENEQVHGGKTKQKNPDTSVPKMPPQLEMTPNLL
jgi:hypothetical protein